MRKVCAFAKGLDSDPEAPRHIRAYLLDEKTLPSVPAPPDEPADDDRPKGGDRQPGTRVSKVLRGKLDGANLQMTRLEHRLEREDNPAEEEARELRDELESSPRPRSASSRASAAPPRAPPARPSPTPASSSWATRSAPTYFVIGIDSKGRLIAISADTAQVVIITGTT